MRWNRIKAIIKKDFREYTKSKYIVFTLILMPLVMSALMAISGVLPIAKVPEGEFSEEDAQVGSFIENLMQKVDKEWDNHSPKVKMLIFTAYGMLFFVSLVPVIIPSILASETIVGEKERKTMEALLASPLSEREIVVGKILSSFLPAIVGTLVSSIVYAVIVDWIMYPFLNRLLFPDALMLVFTFVIAPLASIVCVELMILISTKMSSVRDSYQIGSLIALPVFLFVMGQMVTFFISSIISIIAGVAILGFFAFILFKVAENIFDREKALVKMT